MRRILALTVLLVSLIAIAYFTEERSERHRKEEEQRAAQIYDTASLGSLQGLSTPHAKVLKGGDYYYTAGDYRLADGQIVDKVFDILSHIRARRYFSDEEIAKLNRQDLFSQEDLLFTFYFEKGTLTYRLGKKLDFDRAFYMEIHNSQTDKTFTAIAYDETSDEGAYPAEVIYRSPEKYNRLLNILNLPESFFHDLHVLRRMPLEQIVVDWKSVEASSERNPTFSFDLKNHLSRPVALSGLSYNEKKFVDWPKALVSLKAKRLITGGKKDQLREMDFSFFITKVNGKKESIEVYRQYNDPSVTEIAEDRLYLISSFSDDIFELDAAAANTIRLHHQDLWFKNFFTPEQFQKWPRVLPFTLSLDSLRFEMELDRRGGFSVQTLSPKNHVAIQATFKQLFDLLGMEADYAVTLNQETDDSRLLKQNQLGLEILDRNFSFFRQGEDLYLVDRTTNTALVYKQMAKSFPMTAIDYFNLQPSHNP